MKKLAFLFLVLTSTIVHAQDDFSETFFEEPANAKLELSGSFDVDYSAFWSRKESLLYQLQYYNQNLSDILTSYPLEFYLNGDYQTKDIGVHIKTYFAHTPNLFSAGQHLDISPHPEPVQGNTTSSFPSLSI